MHKCITRIVDCRCFQYYLQYRFYPHRKSCTCISAPSITLDRAALTNFIAVWILAIMLYGTLIDFKVVDGGNEML